MEAQNSDLMTVGALVRNVADVVGILDAKGQFIFVSPAAVSMLGRDPGRNDWQKT